VHPQQNGPDKAIAPLPRCPGIKTTKTAPTHIVFLLKRQFALVQSLERGPKFVHIQTEIMSGAERRYVAIDVTRRTPITHQQASEQVRTFAASPEVEDNALSSNVAQALVRIADGLEAKSNGKSNGKSNE